MADFIEIVEENESFTKIFGSSKFYLRRLSSEALKRIQKKHTKKIKNFRTGEWLYERDEDAINEDILDWCITGWDDVHSPVTKKDVPCTRENKLKLPGVTKIDIITACDETNISGLAGDQKNEKSGT